MSEEPVQDKHENPRWIFFIVGFLLVCFTVGAFIVFFGGKLWEGP